LADCVWCVRTRVDCRGLDDLSSSSRSQADALSIELKASQARASAIAEQATADVAKAVTDLTKRLDDSNDESARLKNEVGTLRSDLALGLDVSSAALEQLSLAIAAKIDEVSAGSKGDASKLNDAVKACVTRSQLEEMRAADDERARKHAEELQEEMGRRCKEDASAARRDAVREAVAELSPGTGSQIRAACMYSDGLQIRQMASSVTPDCGHVCDVYLHSSEQALKRLVRVCWSRPRRAS
jgi:hypothetical protein